MKEHFLSRRDFLKSVFLLAGLSCAGVIAGCNSGSSAQTTTAAGTTAVPTTTTAPATTPPPTGKEFTVNWPSPAGTHPPYLLFRTERRYSPEHYWAMLEADGMVRVGMTDYGQRSIGESYDIWISPAGTVLAKNESFGLLPGGYKEMNFIAPISGTVVEANTRVLENRHFINDFPYDDGWLILLRPDNVKDLDKLLSAEEYARTCCPPCHCAI